MNPLFGVHVAINGIEWSQVCPTLLTRAVVDVDNSYKYTSSSNTQGSNGMAVLRIITVRIASKDDI